jgi:hypothetical protein
MAIQFSRPQQKFLFLLGITVLYLALVAWLNFLQGPYWWDEETFWNTSLTFSDQLIPSLDDLRDYEELNTPLPFVIFGMLEYLFGQGIVAGRLFNLIMSLAIVFIIGWPTRERGSYRMLCLLGLFLCPYYLWLSGRLYTEMLACFLVVLGLMGYTRQRYLGSSLAFVLAIATRQYMLAFPAAIATYEFASVAVTWRQTKQINWSAQRSWLFPLLAASTILFWLYLFQGLAPQSAYSVRDVPPVQTTAWALELGGVVHFLAFVGCYLVIPEFLLFNPRARFQHLRQRWPQHRRQFFVIVLALLLYILVFPPHEPASGNVDKLANLMPHPLIKLGLYYVLSLLACLRFARFTPMALFVAFSALIMIKAYPWDRYVLPVAVAFWYLKSIDRLDPVFPWPLPTASQPSPTDLPSTGVS